jgi:hypothetical protein
LDASGGAPLGSSVERNMSISADEARQIIATRLRADEEKMNAFGSALPGHSLQPKVHLMVTREEEHDCGWVFCYDSREHAVEGKFSFALAGNSPFIVSREDGSIHITGRRPLSEYLDELRKKKSA